MGVWGQHTPPMPEHFPGEEIRTKHKEAIRQLYKQAKFMPANLALQCGRIDN
jgi:hypothetical protein